MCIHLSPLLRARCNIIIIICVFTYLLCYGQDATLLLLYVYSPIIIICVFTYLLCYGQDATLLLYVYSPISSATGKMQHYYYMCIHLSPLLQARCNIIIICVFTYLLCYGQDATLLSYVYSPIIIIICVFTYLFCYGQDATLLLYVYSPISSATGKMQHYYYYMCIHLSPLLRARCNIIIICVFTYLLCYGQDATLLLYVYSPISSATGKMQHYYYMCIHLSPLLRARCNIIIICVFTYLLCYRQDATLLLYVYSPISPATGKMQHYYYMCIHLSPLLRARCNIIIICVFTYYYYMSIHLSPLLRARCNRRSILKRSTVSVNSGYSFS